MTTIMQPLQCDLQPQIQETHRTTHIDTTTRCRTQRRNPCTSGTTPAATAAHTRYLSSPAATTLHGKNQGFVLRLPPQNKAHATFMQPLQYVSQHHVANLHLSTRMATPDDNNHAATPMRSATAHSRNAKNYAHRHNYSLQNTEEEPMYVRNDPSRNRRTHTRGTFHRRLQPLYTEKYKVLCSGFLPKTKPMQHSCSHYITFRSITSQTCISLRTWQHQMTTIMQPLQCDLQPQIQETQRTTHIDTTTRCRTQRRNQYVRNDPSRTRRTHTQGTFHRRLQLLYTEEYKVSCSGFLPKTKPMQHSCSHYNTFRSIT